MDYGKWGRNIVAGIATLSIGHTAFGWGATGHQLVGEAAALLADGPKQAFWAANETNIGKLVNVPDWYWKSLPTHPQERPTHYFEPDAYYSDPSQFLDFPRKWQQAVAKYGEQKLIEHGTAVWRAQQLAGLAVSALNSSNFKVAVEMAGAMGHYVGDLSQPLHVTVNYDGEMTNQKGIHKYFETTNLEKRDYETMKKEVLKRATALLNNKRYRNSMGSTLESIIFNSMDRSYAHIQELLDLDSQLGREKAAAHLYELALERMADGAATYSLILSKIWKNSPNPGYGQTVAIQTPEWVAPAYGRSFSFFKGTISEADCQ